MRLFRKARLKLKWRDACMALAGAVVVLVVIAGIHFIRNSQTPIPYQSRGITAAWIPSTVKHWSSTINSMSKKYDIDPNLVAIIMTMESGGDAKAVSPDNAIGLMQVTPPTASDVAKKYLKKPVSSYNLKDPMTNIEFGVAYLAYLRDYFGTAQQGPSWTSTVELVAAGYNGGPGAAYNLEVGRGLTDDQTIVYSRDAFNMWRERVSKVSPTFNNWKERGGTTLLDAAKSSQS